MRPRARGSSALPDWLPFLSACCRDLCRDSSDFMQTARPTARPTGRLLVFFRGFGFRTAPRPIAPKAILDTHLNYVIERKPSTSSNWMALAVPEGKYYNMLGARKAFLFSSLLPSNHDKTRLRPEAKGRSSRDLIGNRMESLPNN